MKSSKNLVLACALCYAISAAGLAACATQETTSASSDEPVSQIEVAPASSDEPAPPIETTPAGDEELITADIKNVIAPMLDKDAIATNMRKSEEIQAMEEMGMDVNGFAEALSNTIGFDIASVEINGDSAVVSIEFTVPDTGAASNEMVTSALQKLEQEHDLSSMSEEEGMALYINTMTSLIAEPGFPTTVSQMKVDYTKADGTWQMIDRESVENLVGAITSL